VLALEGSCKKRLDFVKLAALEAAMGAEVSAGLIPKIAHLNEVSRVHMLQL
jgi:hypothetical protein